MEHLIKFLDYFGTAIFAVTGALAAGRKRMDIFGMIVLGAVTAVGGGTMRDVVLGHYPVFWVTDMNYLLIAAATCALMFAFRGKWVENNYLLPYADAVGLAVFTVIGFQKGYYVTGKYSVGILMGVTTGVVGGMLRDVLAGEIPLILRREIYASACFGGALALTILTWLDSPRIVNMCAAIAITFGIRSYALRRKVDLPVYSLSRQ